MVFTTSRNLQEICGKICAFLEGEKMVKNPEKITNRNRVRYPLTGRLAPKAHQNEGWEAHGNDLKKKTSMEMMWMKQMIKNIDQQDTWVLLLTWAFLTKFVLFDPEKMFCCRERRDISSSELQDHNFEKFNTAVVSFRLTLP